MKPIKTLLFCYIKKDLNYGLYHRYPMPHDDSGLNHVYRQGYRSNHLPSEAIWKFLQSNHTPY